MNKQVEAEHSSGNVFADMGLPKSDELFVAKLEIDKVLPDF
jgi:hypothetical protein